MAREIINIGLTPNDGQGDTPREVARKINAMTEDLYAGVGVEPKAQLIMSGMEERVDTAIDAIDSTVADVAADFLARVNGLAELAKGDQGIQGERGLQGIQGIQGERGLQGLQGIQGERGLQGLQGIQGERGLQGIQGIQGERGLQGVQGIQGERGLQGLQGIRGDAALQNYTIANLPAPGTTAWAIAMLEDGQKAGEPIGAGTGAMVYSDGTNWRRATDTALVLPYADYAVALDFNRNLGRVGTVMAPVAQLPGFSYIRAGSATVNGASGLIELVAPHVPRREFDLVTRAAAGLLVEPPATNLIRRSQKFDDAIWQRSSRGAGALPVITADAALAPDGTNSADRVLMQAPADGYAISALYQGFGPPAVGAYVLSIYLQSRTGIATKARASVDNAGGSLAIPASMQRTSVIGRVDTIGTRYVQFAATTEGPNGAAPLDFHAWGAQVEAGTTPTSYIPTDATAVTRAGDDMRVPATLADEDYIAHGTANLRAAGTDATLAGLVIDAGNGIQIQRQASGGVRVAVLVAGAVAAEASVAANATTGRIAFAARRRGGKWSIATRFAGTTLTSAEVAGPHPAGAYYLNPGAFAGTGQLNGTVEFIGIKRGTYSDAAIAALLEAA